MLQIPQAALLAGTFRKENGGDFAGALPTFGGKRWTADHRRQKAVRKAVSLWSPRPRRQPKCYEGRDGMEGLGNTEKPTWKVFSNFQITTLGGVHVSDVSPGVFLDDDLKNSWDKSYQGVAISWQNSKAELKCSTDRFCAHILPGLRDHRMEESPCKWQVKVANSPLASSSLGIRKNWHVPRTINCGGSA